MSIYLYPIKEENIFALSECYNVYLSVSNKSKTAEPSWPKHVEERFVVPLVIKMFIYSSWNWFYCTASVCLLLFGGEPLSADLGKFRFVYLKNIYMYNIYIYL